MRPAEKPAAGKIALLHAERVCMIRVLAKSFTFVFLASAGVAGAQVTIGTVVNAGSRIQSVSQFYGIAQGSLFAITGKGLGPDQLQQASFPLPTTDGLAGVTVQASIGGCATVDCILVYVSATEIGRMVRK